MKREHSIFSHVDTLFPSLVVRLELGTLERWRMGWWVEVVSMAYIERWDETRLLETTIGRTILLLPVAPDRAESKLEATVERLFDEGGSGNQTEQGDSTGGEKDAHIQPVIKTADNVVEDVASVRPRRQGKRKSVTPRQRRKLKNAT
ncbi:hypothetical protein Tco_1134491 [Tanacetum coccineum]